MRPQRGPRLIKWCERHWQVAVHALCEPKIFKSLGRPVNGVAEASIQERQATIPDMQPVHPRIIDHTSERVTGSMRQSTRKSSTRSGTGLRAVADCGSFAELAKRASALEALDRALRQTLSLPLRDQVRFADLRQQRLVFLANSPAWASRLRLAQGQILASARAIGVCASSVKITVVTPDIARPHQEPLKSLSPATAAHLRATAGSFQDPDLQAMFLALADRATASPS